MNKLIAPAAVLGIAIVCAPVAVNAAIAGSTSVSGTGKAVCPSGYRVTGGGFVVPRDYTQSGQYNDYYKMLSSAPSGTTAWTVVAEKTTYYPNSDRVASRVPYSAKTYATCVK
jgi:hypothetical protein